MGEPLKSIYDTKELPWRCGKIFEKTSKLNGQTTRHYWSTGDQAELEKAILTLMASERDFVVRITGPAFADKTKNCLKQSSTLELRAIGYGEAYHTKGWEVVYDGKVLDTSADLDEIAARFFARCEEYEVGSYWADLKFSGHCGPSGGRAVVFKEPELKDIPLHTWVFDGKAMGRVVAAGDWPGWYRVWFGGGEISHMPSYCLTPCDPPPEVCGYTKPGQFDHLT